MPKIKFTEAKIKSLKPSTGYVEYYDTRAKHGHGSLGLRVSPTGKKAWFVLYRNQYGKQKRFPLKMDYPKLSLAAANKKLMDLDINNGGDPIEEAKLEAQQKIDEAAAKAKAAGEHEARATMKDLWAMYVEERDSSNKVRSTIIEEDRKWKANIEKDFGNMAIADFTRKTIKDFLKDYAKKSPIAANRLHSLLSVMLNVAVDEEIIDVHPMYRLKKPIKKETPRRRRLSDDEIKDLWEKLDTEGENPRDIMKLMLLTCQRKGEIFKMHWRDIDQEAMLWRQETNKTDVEMLVPLSPQAMEIIKGRQITDSYGWIFPSVKKDRIHVTDIKKSRIRLNKLMGCEDNPWTEHDLRRSSRSLLSRLEVKHHIRERVLNHSVGKIEGTYDVYDYLNEKRDALCKLADEIDKITGQQPKPQGKIIKMKVA